MFEEWKFEAQLRKLQKERERVRSAFIIAHHNRETLIPDALPHTSLLEMQNAEEAVEQLISRYLVTQAERYLVALPYRDSHKDNEHWKFQPTDNLQLQFVLTEAGIQRVREDVREEVKKRWEARFIWLQPMTSLISLLVALGGLAVAFMSLWLKK
jgi:hypothetical protein